MEKISVLFWLNSSKWDKNKESRIFLRITINKDRKDCFTGYKTSVANWDQSSQRIRTSSDKADTFNAYACKKQIEILQIQKDLIISGEAITASSIIDKLKGKTEESVSLLKAFQRHNDFMYPLIGKDITTTTYARYKVSLRKVENFICQKIGCKDVELKKLSIRFITDFEHYLKTNENLCQNTTSKHLKNLKKVIRFSITNQWLRSDPFSTYRCKTTPSNRSFLTLQELKTIENTAFSTDRLRTVRDIFIFSCYTGLAYSDVQKLSPDHILDQGTGVQWISIKRTKTGNESIIPILPKANQILDRYKTHPECLYKGKLLPARSNQKMNEYLNEIGSICKLSKKITYHVARHTFATTITLANGISTEAVCKMLGHASLRTTQIYAKMTMGRIGEEMNSIKHKL